MGLPRPAPLVKPICGVLTADVTLLAETENELQKLLGSIEARAEITLWQQSSYYAAEMGEPLWRTWWSFTALAPAEALADWKLATNALEARLAVAGRRRVNLDPGYIGLLKLVLASTKDAAHRVYLGKGIYAEATLIFERGQFVPLAYTYRDYAAPPTREFFLQVRQRYLAQIRSAHGHT